MLNFASDYLNGCAPQILQRMAETNDDIQPGYGFDKYCDAAKEKIKNFINMPEADVWFISGGTQANMAVVTSMLAPYEAVIAAKTGHISVHEGGSIEHEGHKVMEMDHHDGLLDAEELDKFITTAENDGNKTQMVYPGMVYISQPTELGTVYNKAQLSAIYEVCKKHNVVLFVDGARLGYGLASPACDFDMAELARMCDVFYIGGTKMGALLGEAVVFTTGKTPSHFFTRLKQMGMIMAKARIMGIQFEVLFTDALYSKFAQNAIDNAMYLKEQLVKKGYKLYLDSPTNQQFVIMENGALAELNKKVTSAFIDKYDDNHTVIRFCTHWGTKREEIDELLALL